MVPRVLTLSVDMNVIVRVDTKGNIVIKVRRFAFFLFRDVLPTFEQNQEKYQLTPLLNKCALPSNDKVGPSHDYGGKRQQL